MVTTSVPAHIGNLLFEADCDGHRKDGDCLEEVPQHSKVNRHSAENQHPLLRDDRTIAIYNQH